MLPPPSTPKPDKHRPVIGLLLGIVLAGGVASFLTSCGKSTRKAPPRQEIVTITLPPPPPPPPPPPKVEPPPPKEEPPKEEMVEQAPVPDDEPPPEVPQPEAPPSEALGTGITGNGPDMGLSGSGNGGGRIGGGRKGGGSKWGYYAAQVQTSVAGALRQHPGTKSAAFTLQVRVWADSSGRISRARLVGSSGNPAVDRAIEGQVLEGLQLPEPPPAGMPMPITLRISARKPT